MKKSTLVFIGLNVLVMLVPICVLLGLRFKIQRGDVVDLEKLARGRVKETPLAAISEIEIRGAYDIVAATVLMDSINCIKVDTSDARYFAFKMEGKKLIVTYDLAKDSVENEYLAVELAKRARGDSYSLIRRNVTVLVNSRLKQLVAEAINCDLVLKEKNPLMNDFRLNGISSTISINRNNAGYDYDNNNEQLVSGVDSIPSTIQANLQDSNLGLSVNYIHCLELDMTNSTVEEYIGSFGTMAIVADTNSFFKLDLHDLNRVEVRYRK